MLITLRSRDVYGNTLVYPVNNLAIQLSKLINKKTFNNTDLSNIVELGYKIEYVIWIAIYVTLGRLYTTQGSLCLDHGVTYARYASVNTVAH